MSELSDLLQRANTEGLSAREIARRTNNRVSHATLSRYLHGRHPQTPSEAVLAVFAEALHVPITVLRETSGDSPGSTTPWVPPQESARLSPRVHMALDELVRALAADRRC